MSKARNLSDFISDPAIDSTEIGSNAITTDKINDQAVTPAKLHNTLDLSSKTVTLPTDGISGDSIHGGVISNFASTGIDDNASSTAITIDSDGDICFVKTIGPDYNTIGHDFTKYGEVQFTASNRAIMQINRKDSDGHFAVFRRDGSPVGYIGHNSTDNFEIGATSGGGAGLMLWGGGGTTPYISPMKEGATVNNEVIIGRSGEQFKGIRVQQVNIDNENIAPLTVGGTGTIVQRCNTSGSGYATKLSELFSKGGTYSTCEIIFDQVGWGSVTFDIKVHGYANKTCHLAGGYYQNGGITGPNYSVSYANGLSYSISHEGGQVTKFTISGSMTHPVCEATFTHGGGSGSYIASDSSLSISIS